MKFSSKLTIVFIAIGTILAAFMFSIVNFQMAKILEREIKKDIENRVILTIDFLDRFLYERLGDIRIISSDPIISSGSATEKQITERLIFFRNTYKCYVSLSFFNLERIRIADTAGLHIGEKNPITRYWEDALAGQISAANDVVISKDFEVPIVYFAAPVKNKEDKLIGVVVARILTNRMFEMVKGTAGTQEEESAEIDIINKDGILVYSNHNRAGVSKENLPEWELIKGTQRDKPFGTYKYRNPKKKESEIHFFCRERGYLDFKGNGWIIVTNLSLRAISKPINRIPDILIIMFMVMLFPMALIINFFTKNMSFPLTQLSFAVAEIGKGKLDTVIKIKSKDEIGFLANALKQMLTDLRNNTTSIDNLNKEITERKEADESLKNERAFRESTLNAITDVFYAFDRSGKFLIWNETFRKVTGYNDAELHSMKVTDLFSGEDVQRMAMAIERIWKDGVSKEEASLVFKDGRQVPFEFTGSMLKDGAGNIIGFSGTGRDLSERKEAENDLKIKSLELDTSLKRALQSREILTSMLEDNNKIRENIAHSEAMFRNIFEEAVDGILIVDIESRKFHMSNKAICRMLGYSQEEIINLGFMDIHPGNDLPYVISQMQKQLQTGAGTSVLSNNLSVKRKDGSVFYADVSSTMIHISGKPYVMGFFHDLSERKEIEDLRRIDKLKKNFISNMSHELRTPLNAIIGFSEVLVDQKFGTLNETQRDYLNDILESGKFLLSLINDILDLSKIESGNAELALSDFSLKEFLEHSLIFVKEKAIKHNIELSLEIDEKVGYIRADERKVRQIIYNLLSNAVKFTPDGGKVGIKAKINGSEAQVTVWDTGIGVSKEDQNKLFRPFMQLEVPLIKKYEGTGLGLSLTKELVELHKGKIWVESEGKGKGSSFTFSLPIERV